MTKPTTAKNPIKYIDDLSLNDIFPFSDLSSAAQDDTDQDDTEKVNQAYRKLFHKLIPGFKYVQFVLAEVLEIDRKESQSRLLVYSDLGNEERNTLINEYKEILNSLKDVSPVLISESDAFYMTSRIWCAETEGGPAAGENTGDNIPEKEWDFRRASIATIGIDLRPNPDLQKEEQEIESIFRAYVQRLHERYLKAYPYAYVLLVPIFLNSLSSNRESLKKLGAVFLHFTTTQRVEHIELRRIYSRTLLFWHYYFTSEAIDKRQKKLKEQEARAGIYNKIEPYLDEIRKRLMDIRQPFRLLETELSPVKGFFLGGEELASDFFLANGRAVNLGEDLPEIFPRHDWMDGDVEPYKRIVAGVLIKVLHLESKISSEMDLWENVSDILDKSPELLHRALLNSFPALENRSPNPQQVKDTFCQIKNWFSDSFKGETAAGLPLNMLAFALRLWESDLVIEREELSRFWVASRSPVKTIDALGMINAMCRITKATVAVTKTRSDVSNAPLSCCELKLVLSPMVSKAGSLKELSRSLSKALREDEDPRGDMTSFLWTIGGKRALTLRGTKFTGYEKRNEGEVSIDFLKQKGSPQELKINWRGRVEI